jgi:hypothetical protein
VIYKGRKPSVPVGRVREMRGTDQPPSPGERQLLAREAGRVRARADEPAPLLRQLVAERERARAWEEERARVLSRKRSRGLSL